MCDIVSPIKAYKDNFQVTLEHSQNLGEFGLVQQESEPKCLLLTSLCPQVSKYEA